MRPTSWMSLSVIGAVGWLWWTGCRPTTLEPTQPPPPPPLIPPAAQPAAAPEDPEPASPPASSEADLEALLQERLAEQSEAGVERVAAFLRALEALEAVDPAVARARLLQEIDRSGDLALALAAGERAAGKVDVILRRIQAEAAGAATPEDRANRHLELADALLQVGDRQQALASVRQAYGAIREGSGDWRATALETMTRHLAAIDVERALGFVLDLKTRSPELKTRLFAQAAPAWKQVNARSLKRYLARLRRSGARLDAEGYARVVEGLAPVHPRLALEYLTRIEAARPRYRALGEILIWLARTDPDQARALLARVGRPDARRMLEERLAQGA